MKTETAIPKLSLDRLSFTFQVRKLEDKRLIADNIQNLMALANNTTTGFLKVQSVKFLGDKAKSFYKYHQNYKITFRSGSHSQTITLSIFPLIGENNFLRVELNPSHYRRDEHPKLRGLLAYLLGVEFFKQIRTESKVTKIDRAIDLRGQELKFIMHYPKIKVSEMNYNDDDLEEQMLGHPKSDISIKAYDKLKERKRSGTHFSLRKPWTRIEIRQRHLGISIAELDQVDNPFTRLKLYPWDLPETLGRKFIRDVHAMGLPAALTKRPPEIRQLHRRDLCDLEIALYDPDEIHGQWREALKTLDFLYPDSD